METVEQNKLRMDSLQRRMLLEQDTLEKLRKVLKQELQRYDCVELCSAVDHALVNPEIRKDTFDGTQSFFAEWRTPSGALTGYVIIHNSGQVYAEVNVLKPHPEKKEWFIECITAWGNRAVVHAEPQLLPALGD